VANGFNNLVKQRGEGMAEHCHPSRRAMIDDTAHLTLTKFWDPMRGEPRFEKLMASFAPK